MPVYLKLAASGELAKRAEEAQRRLADCDLCARYCRVDRRKGIKGVVCREALAIAAKLGLSRLDGKHYSFLAALASKSS